MWDVNVDSVFSQKNLPKNRKPIVLQIYIPKGKVLSKTCHCVGGVADHCNPFSKTLQLYG